jgi:DNA-binding NtrC family response regulator
LRVLEGHPFERVGGNQAIKVDVRVIAATNRDLRAMVAEGTFREDLYYRIDVFPLRLPPLAERPDAILPLAGHFLARYAARFGKKVDRFSEAARGGLLHYGWPGNIRELQNVVERAVILARGEIDLGDLNLERPESCLPAEGTLKDLERETIERILRESGGNRRRAAEALGISLRTLQYRIKEYGLS